ncbi:MAG TPA: hypothetical protein PLE88_11840, partial [Anaerohalosphaeraceae bacterium]|nr:hypothetical protein [Anaerohalosphaeraceae bacterium]
AVYELCRIGDDDIDHRKLKGGLNVKIPAVQLIRPSPPSSACGGTTGLILGCACTGFKPDGARPAGLCRIAAASA